MWVHNLFKLTFFFFFENDDYSPFGDNLETRIAVKASKLSPEQIDKFFKRHPNKPDFVAYYDDFIDENFAEYEDCEDFAGYEHIFSA